MNNWQRILIIAYLLGGLWGAYRGYKKCRFEKKNLELIVPGFLYGAFVWADIVVFGTFWAMFSLVTLLLNDWLLFLLGQSFFWFVRSFGETIFWFNQQFSTITRHSLKEYFFAKYFNRDDYTLWFVMQISFQCIAVVSGILSIFFTKLWIDFRF